MRFVSPKKFLDVQGILAQNMYNVCAIFYQFSNVKSGGQSQHLRSVDYQ